MSTTHDAEPQGTSRAGTAEDVRETYADQADVADRFRWLNRLFTGRYRARLFGRADGRVLDVACGTGLNYEYLPASTSYVGVDLSPQMLANARQRVGDEDRVEALSEVDARSLAFDDDAFDTVVSSLSTCTFPEPVAVLDEMARVCDPDGSVRLLEHGRSSVGPVARFQDWRADAHYEKPSCRWNQDPVALVESSALDVRDASTAFLGIITAIEAVPPE
jgi:ubiquinone/menaquinone biosynthesis C-methylase UbiE